MKRPFSYRGLIGCCCAALLAASALGQPSPFTLDQVLGAAFPTELSVAPAGGKAAWVSNARGVRNIMFAEPPQYAERKVTNYSTDDGQDLGDLCWTPEASAIVYVRGESANRFGEYPDPAIDPRGAEQALWIVRLDGSPPRKIGEGDSPAVSPRGDRVAFIRQGRVWWAPLGGVASPSQPFQARGVARRPVWSPDGTRLSFISDRGDHSWIGIYDVSAGTLRYLDPSTDFDSQPEWSPDGRAVAFLREPSHGSRPVYGPRRADEPWSIRVGDPATGRGREVWKARPGPGSVFREVRARNQILWAGGGRLVFPWEGDGWTHLYSVSAEGGNPLLLTPGNFEVEYVSLAPDGGEVVFNSNQGDIDRRHLWRVAAAGGAPVPLSSGNGIEWSPAETSDGKALVFFRSDARRPARPAIRIGTAIRDIDPSAIPPDFPLRDLVVPQQVTFPSTDGLMLHGQLFLPPRRNGGRAPAVVFFHGGPRRQMLLGWHYMSYYTNAYALNQYLANQGYVVLAVNFRSGIGYGLDFREAPRFGAAGASDYGDVQAAGEFLRARADVDPARIGVWGGSYGGYLTAMALGRDSSVFHAGVDLAGVHDWALEYDIPATDPAAKIAFDSSPMAFLETWRSPVLLVQGDDDRNVKFAQTVILADALRKRGVTVEELIFPDEIHDFLLYRSWLAAFQDAARFLDRYLRAGQ
ncbi:MAG TPA: alpha/beta fold hydrolase [Bryobacteraceae bacterium]|nr:alpha/beta fold hydrolase [Bryobacteraceae bacterium]